MRWKVEIDIDNLERESAKLGSLITELHNNINDTSKLIESLRDFWEGDAAEAYIDLLDIRLCRACGMLISLQKLKRAVDTQVSELRNVDQWYEKLWYQLFVN